MHIAQRPTVLQLQQLRFGNKPGVIPRVLDVSARRSVVCSARSNQLQVVFVSSEVAPWSKTGGLGDVAAALPAALAARGHKVMTVAPRYTDYPGVFDTGLLAPVELATAALPAVPPPVQEAPRATVPCARTRQRAPRASGTIPQAPFFSNGASVESTSGNEPPLPAAAHSDLLLAGSLQGQAAGGSAAGGAAARRIGPDSPSSPSPTDGPESGSTLVSSGGPSIVGASGGGPGGSRHTGARATASLASLAHEKAAGAAEAVDVSYARLYACQERGVLRVFVDHPVFRAGRSGATTQSAAYPGAAAAAVGGGAAGAMQCTGPPSAHRLLSPGAGARNSSGAVVAEPRNGAEGFSSAPTRGQTYPDGCCDGPAVTAAGHRPGPRGRSASVGSGGAGAGSGPGAAPTPGPPPRGGSHGGPPRSEEGPQAGSFQGGAGGWEPPSGGWGGLVQLGDPSLGVYTYCEDLPHVDLQARNSVLCQAALAAPVLLWHNVSDMPQELQEHLSDSDAASVLPRQALPYVLRNGLAQPAITLEPGGTQRLHAALQLRWRPRDRHPTARSSPLAAAGGEQRPCSVKESAGECSAVRRGVARGPADRCVTREHLGPVGLGPVGAARSLRQQDGVAAPVVFVGNDWPSALLPLWLRTYREVSGAASRTRAILEARLRELDTAERSPPAGDSASQAAGSEASRANLDAGATAAGSGARAPQHRAPGAAGGAVGDRRDMEPDPGALSTGPVQTVVSGAWGATPAASASPARAQAASAALGSGPKLSGVSGYNSELPRTVRDPVASLAAVAASEGPGGEAQCASTSATVATVVRDGRAEGQQPQQRLNGGRYEGAYGSGRDSERWAPSVSNTARSDTTGGYDNMTVAAADRPQPGVLDSPAVSLDSEQAAQKALLQQLITAMRQTAPTTSVGEAAPAMAPLPLAGAEQPAPELGLEGAGAATVRPIVPLPPWELTQGQQLEQPGVGGGDLNSGRVDGAGGGGSPDGMAAGTQAAERDVLDLTGEQQADRRMRSTLQAFRRFVSSRLRGAKVVTAVHNLAFQGLFPEQTAARLGLPRSALDLLRVPDGAGGAEGSSEGVVPPASAAPVPGPAAAANGAEGEAALGDVLAPGVTDSSGGAPDPLAPAAAPGLGPVPLAATEADAAAAGDADGASGGFVSWLRAALLASDLLVTVSPSYARELVDKATPAAAKPAAPAGTADDASTRGGPKAKVAQPPASAADGAPATPAAVATGGLNNLRLRPDGQRELCEIVASRGIHGIRNGLDPALWDPARDALLSPDMRFGRSDVAQGKARAKAQLQARLGLQVDPHIPLFGFVGRLEEQKGVDVILAALPEILGPSAMPGGAGPGRLALASDPAAVRYAAEEARRARTMAWLRRPVRVLQLLFRGLMRRWLPQLPSANPPAEAGKETEAKETQAATNNTVRTGATATVPPGEAGLGPAASTQQPGGSGTGQGMETLSGASAAAAAAGPGAGPNGSLRVVGTAPEAPGLQLALLGQGQRWMQDGLAALPRAYPGRAAGVVGFDEPLCHLLMAGCDFLLVPSRWEPCGLVALAALRYGTVPLVAPASGLLDVVSGLGPEAEGGTPSQRLTGGSATMQGGQVTYGTGREEREEDGVVDDSASPPLGIVMDRPVGPADDSIAKREAAWSLARAVRQARQLYGTDAFTQLRDRCMAEDVSWDRPAVQWEELLRSLVDSDEETSGASASEVQGRG